ncbi:phage tail domain-containing protein [Aurantimicrobium minutum]|uniref:Minor tail protein n=1 Tax=Aurantimicrobium minutum TaxID=708131 RepID=A0A173LXN5_9MICO|nr:phage tail domain-containing protein [Aurantimicrobium minutum]BAU99612.1 Uncharacterized protein AUMI_110700 [Aurantimicrobium minutum]
MVNVTLSLVGANGDEIVFTDAGDYVLTTGLSGMGIPSTSVRIDDSASDGGVWRFSKRGIREMDLPVVVFGTDRVTVESNLRRLSNLLHDKSGGTVLRASYSTGEVWELTQGHYVAGAETTKGEDANVAWSRWVLSMQFANPFWIRQQAESFSVAVPGTGRSLIPDLAELRVTGSQAIGEIEIENLGDVEAYPVWSFQGPADAVSVTSQNGLSFEYAAPIATGSTITVNTAAGTVVDEDGVNQYANLAVAPKLFTLPAGNSSVTVEAVGADANTLISLYYQPRKEVVH